MKQFIRIFLLVVIAIVTVACATTSKKGAALPTYPDQLTEEAKQSFYHAESLYNAHDFVNAEKAYQEFIQNHGYNSLTDQAYFILGEIAFKRNDFNTSAAQYEQAFSRVYSPKISPKAQYQGALAHFKMDKPSRSLEILSPMKREDMNSQLRFEGDSLAIQSCKALGYPSSYSIVWYLLLLDDYHSVWGSLEEAGENITSVPRYEVNEKIKEWIEDSSVTVESIKKLPIDYMKGKLSYAYVSYKMGLTAFHEGEYKIASEQLKEYLRSYPKHEYADAARNLLAEVGIDFGEEEYTIGVILPLSGKYKIYGEAVLHGIECAAGIYKPCGSSGSFKLVIKDTEGDPLKAAQAVNELAAMDDVLAIVGPLLGSEAQAAATVAQQQSIPLIAVTRDDDISKKGDYIFHDFLNAESEVNALIDYAIKEKELKSFVIMYPNSEYGKQYSKMFAEKVEQNGAAVIENYMYEPNEVDFKDESCMVYYGTTDVDIKEPEIEGRQFDAVFIPDSYRRVSYIVPTLRYVGMSDKVQVLGTSRWNNPQLIDRTKDYIQGAVFTAGFHKESKEFLISKFVDTFKEAYSDEPTLLEAEGYDATRLIIKAIGNTGGKKRSSIKTDILKTVEYPGVTGMISVDSNGSFQKKVHLLGVVGDKIVPYNEMELLKKPIEIESVTIELE